DTPPSAIYTLSLHDALPICSRRPRIRQLSVRSRSPASIAEASPGGSRQLGCGASRMSSSLEMGKRYALTTSPSAAAERVCEVNRSEEHTSELQSRENLVCRL